MELLLDILIYIIALIGCCIIYIVALKFLFGALVRIVNVPRNAAIITDKNSHYYKTKRCGVYFLEKNEVVTSYVSKRPHKEYYIQISESRDGELFYVSYLVDYEAYDVDATLERLKFYRRSITDIIKSSLKTTIENFDFSKQLTEFLSEASKELTSNFAPFEIRLISMKVFKISEVDESHRSELFVPQIGSSIDPTQYR